MSAGQWIGFAVGLSTLTGAFAMSVRHLVKHYLAELKPNSGSSMRDEQTRQGQMIQKLEARVDDIYRLLVQKS